MTKDVELHSSTWKTMKQAITGLTENATVSSSGYGNYTNAQAGSYSTGTTSTGFAKRVEDLVKISEKVQKLIKEKDTDGVVSYTYHDETSTAQTLQAKLSTLERYAENVNTYINKKIDRPFYEAMDKVGAKLEALNIQKYKTTNKIGYKRIESVKDPYGHPVGTKEVTPPEIGIDELYKVDSPYKASLKKSYEEYKKSKDWGTGRELDGNERAMRGAFALLDLIPAGKYLGDLAKTGKTAGLTAVKTSIKTAVKEGVEQGAKNFDTFKGLLKKTKGLGDNIYHSLSTYRKQLARHLQNTVDEGLLNLSRATQEGLERAKQFTLEVPTVVVRETSTGSQMMRFEKMSKSLGDTGLGKSLDNLASKAKHVENTRLDRLRARNAFYGNKVDDVVEAGSKASKDTAENIIRDGSHFDEFGNLRPNIRYQAGEFEYIYQTDDLGRLTNWDAEELHLTERTKRLPHDSKSPGKLSGDQAGHMAGDRFGGSPRKDNVVSQLRKVNLSDYKKLENQWAKALEEGKDVSVSVKLNYVGDSLRPDSFEVRYIIDGVPIKSIIEN